ncbi:MAG: mannosyltransferase family protein [Pirellulales bacterium]
MTGIRYYLLTSFVVLLGVVYGSRFVKFCDEHPKARRGDLVLSAAAWDGEWYEKIASEGYSYSPGRQSAVAFYPAYPLLAATVTRLTGLDTRSALLLVSNLCFALSLVLLGEYLSDSEARHGALLAAGLLPATFYFRMAYSESLFFLLCIAAMLGMARRWPTLLIAVLIGAACGTRPVGAALLPPFVIHLWPVKRGAADLAKFFLRAAVLLPVACWGIFAYAFYQWLRFDEPLAFLWTQQHWGRPTGDPVHQVLRLLTLAPVADVYDSTSNCSWANVPPRDGALFSMMFANPIYFFASVGCVVIGAWKRWLNAKEIALSGGLLLIPYVTQADRMCMASMARFASEAFPVYIVVGSLITRLPGPIVGMLAALSAAMLAIYTAMFVNWYWYF